MQTWTGRTLPGDRYDLGEVIGSGRVARVHRAYDRRLRRPVAVKLLPRAGDTAPRWRSEAAALDAVDHPYVVRLLDGGEVDGVGYLVLPLFPGALAEVLHRGPLTAGRAEYLADALADALRHVHRAGLVHGGIDAETVLIGADGGPALSGLPAGTGPGTTSPESDLDALEALLARSVGAGPVRGVRLALGARGADRRVRPVPVRRLSGSGAKSGSGSVQPDTTTGLLRPPPRPGRRAGNGAMALAAAAMAVAIAGGVIVANGSHPALGVPAARPRADGAGPTTSAPSSDARPGPPADAGTATHRAPRIASVDEALPQAASVAEPTAARRIPPLRSVPTSDPGPTDGAPSDPVLAWPRSPVAEDPAGPGASDTDPASGDRTPAAPTGTGGTSAAGPGEVADAPGDRGSGGGSRDDSGGGSGDDGREDGREDGGRGPG